MIWPLGVLNRGTERRGSDEERTPSSSNRARRRTKLEVHGDARTRPESERLRKRKETPSRTVLGPLLSPFKAPSGVRARDGRELSDTERAAFAKCVHFAQRCGQASVADVCKEWGISKSHGYRILNRWRTEESVQSRPRSGRPRALTQEDMKMLESLSEEVKGYFTWESITKRFTERTGKRVSCTTVFNSCKHLDASAPRRRTTTSRAPRFRDVGCDFGRYRASQREGVDDERGSARRCGGGARIQVVATDEE